MHRAMSFVCFCVKRHVDMRFYKHLGISEVQNMRKRGQLHHAHLLLHTCVGAPAWERDSGARQTAVYFAILIRLATAL